MGRRDLVIERIWAKTKLTAFPLECWIWQGPTSGDGRGGGYPRMSLNGQTVAVHRVVYTHFFGYIPGKKRIDHKCCNRCCVNPNHLELVSHRENQKRRMERRKV